MWFNEKKRTKSNSEEGQKRRKQARERLKIETHYITRIQVEKKKIRKKSGKTIEIIPYKLLLETRKSVGILIL